MSSNRLQRLAAQWLLSSSLLLQAQVVIAPRVSTVLEGRTCTFRIRTVAGKSPETLLRGLSKAEAWTWTILEGVGTIDEATGCYTAPAVADPCLVKVRATCREEPELQVENRFLVLPFQPFDTIDKVLGPHWLEPLAPDLPFMNPATGRRYDERARVLPWQGAWRPPPPVHYGGYGLPFTLTWPHEPGADAEFLTVGRGPLLPHAQTDVTGQPSVTVDAKGYIHRYTVEALMRVPGTSDTWQSRIQEGAIHLRGLTLHAGNDILDPGHQDGHGLSAQFREPFGLAQIHLGREGYRPQTAVLVSDRQEHVIRLLGEDGRVSTPWGRPGQPGHQDRGSSPWRRLAAALCLEGFLGPPPAEETLFNGPTFLWVRSRTCELFRNRKWTSCLVADSGNHAIRVLHPDGTVATLAGDPGHAGHRDSTLPRQALFNQPQGLVEDKKGNVYVADQGNQVIRVIAPTGTVTTLAGSPGQSGAQDGTGSAARFTQLGGMAINAWQPPFLYVADGHAIRRITIPAGEVTTMLGSVTTPGFREIQGGTREDRRQACGQPCLNRPCGLLTKAGGLVIADLGNHCVRNWSPSEVTLTTLAGDPSLDENRWGLPRDGMQAPPGDHHAALEAPRTLAACEGQPEDFLVTTGSCLGRLSPTLEFRDRLGEVELDFEVATPSEPCVVRFSVEARTSLGEPSLRRLRYSVDFLEPDGSLADHQQGTSTTSTPISVQGTFAQRGTGTVVVHCVTNQGVATGSQRAIVIR